MKKYKNSLVDLINDHLKEYGDELKPRDILEAAAILVNYQITKQSKPKLKLRIVKNSENVK